VNCGYALTGGPNSQGQGTSSPVAVASTSGHRVTGALGPGVLLGGRYRIVQALGKGGFGAVYKAVDTRFQGQRVVAIKEMSDAQLSQSEKAQALQDFRHEANLLVQLNHPYLPNVSDFFEEAGKAYLVMEFVEGTTLEKKQEQAGGPLDESLVMGWALQLCTVLHYLHTRPQPIIFRDMKPSNVMVTNEGEIKLIDFGIARVFKASATKDTTLLGSVGYAPLEQYGRGQSDARSDIYALGATMYDLLTKEVPADAPGESADLHDTAPAQSGDLPGDRGHRTQGYGGESAGSLSVRRGDGPGHRHKWGRAAEQPWPAHQRPAAWDASFTALNCLPDHTARALACGTSDRRSWPEGTHQQRSVSGSNAGQRPRRTCACSWTTWESAHFPARSAHWWSGYRRGGSPGWSRIPLLFEKRPGAAISHDAHWHHTHYPDLQHGKGRLDAGIDRCLSQK
jgi:serine/threonine protein kinase